MIFFCDELKNAHNNLLVMCYIIKILEYTLN